MSDSDKPVTTGEAARQLGISDDTVRRYFDSGLLGGQMLGGRHRRVSPASIEALARVLRMPPGPERDAAMDDLRRRNRGDSDTPPADA